MMKRLLWLAVFVLPLLTTAQGIRFENTLSWKEVRAKAKKENKYIFIDCAASWCVPCKKMEKEVFPLKNVGDFMNERFISVHVQLDTSKADDEFTKAWYADAHALQQRFKIASYPTYLFFAPNGQVLHRYGGAMPDSLFFKVVANALNPDKQYYTLWERYRSGKKEYTKMMYLANVSKRIGQDSVAKVVARDYLEHYLNSRGTPEILQIKNLDFLSSFSDIIRSSDRVFTLFESESTTVDSILKFPGFSRSVIIDVITREEITPVLWHNKQPVSVEPNWKTLRKNLGQKYGEKYAGEVLVNAQIRWYSAKKDWPNKIKYIVEKQEKYGLDTAGIGWALVNNTIYDLFLPFCTNVDTLNIAIGWMEVINKAHPDDAPNLDTYANLLYKVGRKSEAIAWEQKALELDEQEAQKASKKPDETYRETINKMKSGALTWESN